MRSVNDSTGHLTGNSTVIDADDASIAAALEDASIPCLMMSMIHMSGDTSLLDGAIRPQGVYINEFQGFMDEKSRTTIRAQALEVIKAYRDGGCKLPPSPTPETIHRMMEFLVAQEVPVPPENIIVPFSCSLFVITFVLQFSRSDGAGHRLGVTQQCYPSPAIQQFERY